MAVRKKVKTSVRRKKTIKRPKKKPPTQGYLEIDLENVRRYSALGLKLGQIAACFGISAVTFAVLRKKHPEIDKAILEGRGSKVAEVVEALLKNAVENENVIAQMFFLKCKGNFIEHEKQEEENGHTIEDLSDDELDAEIEALERGES